MISPEQREWVARVLGVVEPPSSDRDDLKPRLATLAADLKRVPAASGLAEELRAAIALAKDGDAAAGTAVEALEEQIAELTRASRVAAMAAELAAARPSKAGFVAIAKARLEWAEVEADYEVAAGNLVDGAYALLDTPPFRDDPRAQGPEAAGVVEALRGRLPPLAGVGEAVNAALDSDGPGRSARIAAAIGVIDSFLPQLQSDPNLLMLETAAGNYPSVSLLSAALGKLRRALGGIDADPAADVRSAA